MPEPTVPKQEYRVELSCYSGPLDLLLFLVRRHEIDLNDIPIAQLTQQYFEHLKVIQVIDVQRASEFLVMAATLLEIKSAMLLPRPDQENDTDQSSELNLVEQLDPRYELVQQLLAYKRYKDAAGELESRRQQWEDRYACRPLRRGLSDGDTDGSQDHAPHETDQMVQVDLEDANVLDLCEAFARILETVGRGPAQHQVVWDDTPISLHAEDILDRLKRDGPVTLEEVFAGRTQRVEMIGLFLAVLELVRQRSVLIVSQPDDQAMALQLRTVDSSAEEAEQDQADPWRDPQTGQIQYEWPDEESRRRAQARAARREQAAGPPDEQDRA